MSRSTISTEADDVVQALRATGRRAIAIKGDVAKRARRRADDRQGLAGARADRHPREQRRHRDDRAVSRADRRAVDAAGRRQPARRVALLAGLLPPGVAEGRKGSIVNIGSIQAAKVLPGRTHYAPTKLGLEALTRNMSAEMTPLGIRVNCIHPGLIDTPMTSWVMKDPACCRQSARPDLARARRPAARDRRGRGVLRVGRSQLSDRPVDLRRRRMAGEVTRTLIDLSMEDSNDCVGCEVHREGRPRRRGRGGAAAHGAARQGGRTRLHALSRQSIAENPDLFLLYEHYADQAALAAHRETPHFKEIIEGTIVPLLDKRERELYTSVIDVTQPVTMKLRLCSNCRRRWARRSASARSTPPAGIVDLAAALPRVAARRRADARRGRARSARRSCRATWWR